MRINRVKEALRQGRVQVGCSTSQVRSPEVMRALGAAGLDWTFIDSEHGGFDLETLQDLCRAANQSNLCPVVRVADLQYALVARALDCGAQGVLFPRVESPELLDQAISWTRFPPLGKRGFGLTMPHLEYESVSMADAITHLNQETMVVLQIETKTALERVNELLSVPNVDAVLIGPADLSVSLGVPGQFDHPSMIAAIEKIRDACNAHNVAPGIHFRALSLVQFWRERGLRLLSCNSEVGLLFDQAQQNAKAMRG